MKKKNKNISGLTLVEILIGIVVSSLMMGAIYTTYSVVNNTYNQVVEKAKISRSSRDLIELLIRDTRMAGFKYYLGTNSKGYPKETYLTIGDGTSIPESHDPIVIIPAINSDGTLNSLGHKLSDVIKGYTDPADSAGEFSRILGYASTCCDKIHIVYDDFNQNHKLQPYKRYKVTYYALKRSEGGEERYAIYKSKIQWKQARTSDTGNFPSEGEWEAYPDCKECYHDQLVRDYVDDMEFVPIGKEGKKIAYPNPITAEGRESLYNLRAVDIRIAFKSKKDFFRSKNPNRNLKGFSKDAIEFDDRKLRDNIVVTVYTRNIGGDLF